MKRIAIIGNAGGGKSTLARTLGARLGIPVHEVDRAQWQPGWARTAPEELARAYDAWLAAPAWIIDGWGSWEALAARFDRADTIILVDFPLMIHYWWALKRHVQTLWQPSPAWPPPGCPAWPVTWRLCKLMWQIHWTMRPRLLELIGRYRSAKRVVYIRSPRALRHFLAGANPGTSVAVPPID